MPVVKSLTSAEKPAPRLIKLRQAADRCHVSPDTLRAWADSYPDFPRIIRIRGRLYMNEAELLRWLEAQRVPPGGADGAP